MERTTVVWFVIAATLVLVGLILFAVVMTGYQWDFTKLGTGEYETNTYEISEDFSNISVDTNTADILFVLSEDGKCTVECYEEEKEAHSATVQEDTLVISVKDEKAWYDYIGINYGTPKITVYLPKMEYGSLSIKESTGDVEIPDDFLFGEVDISLSTGDVAFCASASGMIKIKTSTGDIRVENISAGALDLSVSTGEVTASGVSCEGDVTVVVSTGKAYLTDIACKSVISRGNTGDISLKNVIAAESFSIERSTGDVKFESCDAAEIFVETDTGDVTGSLLTEKIFIIETSTGDVRVPESLTGGKCKITTSTGDIRISIKE